MGSRLWAKAYEIKCGSVRCMLGKKNKRVYQSCVSLDIKGYDVSFTKGGVQNASGGIGSGDGGVQVKVGNELVGDKELDKEAKRLYKLK